MSNHALPDDAQRALNAYAERLRELIASCAAQQRLEPEAFLWNSRRALETVCHILLTVHHGRPSRTEAGRQETLDGTINQLWHAKLLKEEDKNRLHNIRTQSNLGVHVRSPDREDYPAAVSDLAHALPQVVHWLVRDSRAAPYLRDTGPLLAVAKEIRDGGREASTLAVAARDWQDKYVNLQDRYMVLQDRHIEMERRLSALEGTDSGRGSGPVRPALRAAVEVDPDSETEEVYDEPFASDPPTAERGGGRTTGRVQPAPQGRRWGVVLGPVVLIGALVGTLISVAFVRASKAPAPPAPEPVAPAKVEAPAPPTLSCPDGMTLVGASTLRLGLPRGRGEKDLWSQTLVGPSGATDVPAFCIDIAPRTRAQFAGWSGSAGVSKTDCLWSDVKFSADKPVACVDRESAARYCADQGPGFALPSLAQWEAQIRVDDGSLSSGIKGEWAADAFPPEILGRRSGACKIAHCDSGVFRTALKSGSPLDPNGNLLWSWDDQERGHGWSNLGFRCASAPTSSSAAVR